VASIEGIPADVRKRMRGMRKRGASLAKIAATFNKDGVPTAHGGVKWYPATISRALGQ